MTILLTGATGFLGSHLLEGLLENNYEVIILKRSFSNCWRIEEFLSQVTSYDIDKVSLESVFEENSINAVIHTATCYGRNGETNLEIFNSNVSFSMQLLEYARIYRIESFFNTDSFFNTESFQYDYLNTYTLSKKHFVDWGKNYSSSCDVQFINMKLQHVYGPKDDESKFVSWFIKQLKEEVPEIKLTAGTQKRDFIYVKDVVESYLVLLLKNKELPKYEEFEVGTGDSIEVKDFLLQIVCAYENKIASSIKSNLNFGAIPMREGEPLKVSANLTTWSGLNIHKKKTNFTYSINMLL